jgi:DNA gyrase inhibitor GyrI
MNKPEIRIVKLEPMRVASVHGFGESPEGIAWNKLWAWAEPKGLLDDPEKHRIFGFDNPAPSPGSPNYGYDFWILVGPEVEPEGDASIKDFDGGLYAVARCEGLDNIGPVWKQLVRWREDSHYQRGHHQWLEEHIGQARKETPPEELVMDLYLPIVE